jgi:hypothetical protein
VALTHRSKEAVVFTKTNSYQYMVYTKEWRSFKSFFYIKNNADLQSTPSGAISKCVIGSNPEGRSHPITTLRHIQERKGAVQDIRLITYLSVK